MVGLNPTINVRGFVMPMIKKSITVTDKQNEWLQAQMELGLYASDSELLRDLIRQNKKMMPIIYGFKL